MKSLIRKKSKTLKKPISHTNNFMIRAERRHIQAHLALTELRLRLKRSNNPRRAQTLDILHGYWKSGVFPQNTYSTTRRKPVFIDSNGVYCAVGHLMAQTGYEDLAQSLDNQNKFILVEELDDERSATWLNQYGLTKHEAALIQPGYGGVLLERVSYSTSEKLLAAATLAVCLVFIGLAIFGLLASARRSPAKAKKHWPIICASSALALYILLSSTHDRTSATGILPISIGLLTALFVFIGLFALTKWLSHSSKRLHLLLMLSGCVVFVLIGYLFFVPVLPTPTNAVNAFTFTPSVSNEARAGETVVCGGWGTPEGQESSVCKEYLESGSVPGWEKVDFDCDYECPLYQMYL